MHVGMCSVVITEAETLESDRISCLYGEALLGRFIQPHIRAYEKGLAICRIKIEHKFATVSRLHESKLSSEACGPPIKLHFDSPSHDGNETAH